MSEWITNNPSIWPAMWNLVSAAVARSVAAEFIRHHSLAIAELITSDNVHLLSGKRLSVRLSHVPSG